MILNKWKASAGGIDEHNRHVADIRVAIEGLGVRQVASDGVGAGEATEAIDIVAGLRIVVAGFGIPLVGR